MSFKHIVLISGANRGVGFEAVKKLAQDPNYHIILGSRSLSQGQEAASSLPAPASVEPLEIDVTLDESIEAAVETVKSKYGRLDALVNNAGIGLAAFEPGTPRREMLEKTFATNTTGSVCMTEAFLPLLRQSKSPRLVFVSSAVGSIAETLDPKASHYGASPIAMAYKASKAAQNLTVAHYAVLLRDEPFRVNACTPGLSATKFSGGRGRDPSIGAEIIVRLAKGEVEGTGGFWDNDGRLPW